MNLSSWDVLLSRSCSRGDPREVDYFEVESEGEGSEEQSASSGTQEEARR